MTRKSHRNTTKIVALLAAGIFLFSDITQAGSLIRPAADAPSFEPPLEFCSLKERYIRAGAPLIIHIQDAHSNLSGQENLSKTIDSLMTRYKIHTVLVEGGTKDDTLTPIKNIASDKVWRRVARKFLIEGRISGEEYLNLTSSHPMKMLGIEDERLYMRSLRAYAELVKKREASLAYLARIRRAVETLKRRVYPKELLDYEEWSSPQSFSGDPVDSRLRGNDRLTLLIQLAQKYSIPTSLNHLPKSFNNPDELSKVNFDAVLDEMERLEEEVYSQILKGVRPLWIKSGYPQGSDPFKLRAIDRYLRLLENAYRIQMSSEEYRLFDFNEKDFSTLSMLAFLNRELLDRGAFEDMAPYEDILEKGKKSLRRFYGSVAARDRAFVRNTERIIDKTGNVIPSEVEGSSRFLDYGASASARNDKRAVILIAGGYHTDHLKRLFREKGWSYVILTPNIRSETIQRKYEEVLLEPLGKAENGKWKMENGPRSRSAVAHSPSQSGVRHKASADSSLPAASGVRALPILEPAAASRLASLMNEVSGHVAAESDVLSGNLHDQSMSFLRNLSFHLGNPLIRKNGLRVRRHGATSPDGLRLDDLIQALSLQEVVVSIALPFKSTPWKVTIRSISSVPDKFERQYLSNIDEVQTLLLKLMIKQAFTHVSPLRFVDLDSGSGAFVPAFGDYLKNLLRVDVRVMGVEPMKSLVENIPSPERRLYHADPEGRSAPNYHNVPGLSVSSQDIVTINNIDSRPWALIQQAKRVLKPGGLLIITFLGHDVISETSLGLIRFAQSLIDERDYRLSFFTVPEDYKKLLNKSFPSPPAMMLAAWKLTAARLAADVSVAGAFRSVFLLGVLMIGMGAGCWTRQDRNAGPRPQRPSRIAVQGSAETEDTAPKMRRLEELFRSFESRILSRDKNNDTVQMLDEFHRRLLDFLPEAYRKGVGAALDSKAGNRALYGRIRAYAAGHGFIVVYKGEWLFKKTNFERSYVPLNGIYPVKSTVRLNDMPGNPAVPVVSNPEMKEAGVIGKTVSVGGEALFSQPMVYEDPFRSHVEKIRSEMFRIQEKLEALRRVEDIPLMFESGGANDVNLDRAFSMSRLKLFSLVGNPENAEPLFLQSIATHEYGHHLDNGNPIFNKNFNENRWGSADSEGRAMLVDFRHGGLLGLFDFLVNESQLLPDRRSARKRIRDEMLRLIEKNPGRYGFIVRPEMSLSVQTQIALQFWKFAQNERPRDRIFQDVCRALGYEDLPGFVRRSSTVPPGARLAELKSQATPVSLTERKVLERHDTPMDLKSLMDAYGELLWGMTMEEVAEELAVPYEILMPYFKRNPGHFQRYHIAGYSRRETERMMQAETLAFRFYADLVNPQLPFYRKIQAGYFELSDYIRQHDSVRTLLGIKADEPITPSHIKKIARKLSYLIRRGFLVVREIKGSDRMIGLGSEARRSDEDIVLSKHPDKADLGIDAFLRLPDRPEADPLKQIVAEEAWDAVGRAISRLKPEWKEPLLLIIRGTSYEQAAEELNISSGKLREIVYRARKFIKERSSGFPYGRRAKVRLVEERVSRIKKARFDRRVGELVDFIRASSYLSRSLRGLREDAEVYYHFKRGIQIIPASSGQSAETILQTPEDAVLLFTLRYHADGRETLYLEDEDFQTMRETGAPLAMLTPSGFVRMYDFAHRDFTSKDVALKITAARLAERGKAISWDGFPSRVAIVTSEAVPFAKGGGLGDSAAQQAAAIARQGSRDERGRPRVSLVMPEYRRKINGNSAPPDFEVRSTGIEYSVPVGNAQVPGAVKHAVVNGVDHWLFHASDPSLDYTHHLYDTTYPDSALGQAVFISRSVMEIIPKLVQKNLMPAPDVIHAHDWMTALVPILARLEHSSWHLDERNDFKDSLSRAMYFYRIHNAGLSYQGQFPDEWFGMLGLHLTDPAQYARDFSLRGGFNLARAAMALADGVDPVSRGYGGEILGDPSLTEGLGEVAGRRLQEGAWHPIANGLDKGNGNGSGAYRGFTDAEQMKKIKPMAKTELQKRFGLKVDPKAPIISMIARLDPDQKGTGLVRDNVEKFLRLGAQVIIFNDMNGFDEEKANFRNLAQYLWQSGYDGRFRFYLNDPDDRLDRGPVDLEGYRIDSNDKLVYAGSDLFLVPSKTEPFGLTPPIAMLYGTVPIVRKTGGLQDTVRSFHTQRRPDGNGFIFEGYDKDELFGAIVEAMAVYNRPAEWKEVVSNALNSDYSWDRRVQEFGEYYLTPFERLLRHAMSRVMSYASPADRMTHAQRRFSALKAAYPFFKEPIDSAWGSIRARGRTGRGARLAEAAGDRKNWALRTLQETAEQLLEFVLREGDRPFWRPTEAEKEKEQKDLEKRVNDLTTELKNLKAGASPEELLIAKGFTKILTNDPRVPAFVQSLDKNQDPSKTVCSTGIVVALPEPDRKKSIGRIFTSSIWWSLDYWYEIRREGHRDYKDGMHLYEDSFSLPIDPSSQDGFRVFSFQKMGTREEWHPVPAAIEGAAVAARHHSKIHPYWYVWPRDAALLIKGLIHLVQYVDLPPDLKRRINHKIHAYLFQYMAKVFEEDDKSRSRNFPDLLGFAKWEVDGTIYSGPWGNPQFDGAALTVVTYVDQALARMEQTPGTATNDQLRKETWPIVQRLTAFVSRTADQPCFDLWEELYGLHFYTRMAQARALDKAVVLAKRLSIAGEEIERWEAKAVEIRQNIRKDHIKPLDQVLREMRYLHEDDKNKKQLPLILELREAIKQKYLEAQYGDEEADTKAGDFEIIVSTVTEQDRRTVRPIDSSVIGAIIHSIEESREGMPFLTAVDLHVIQTFAAHEIVFRSLYPINGEWKDENGPRKGQGIGRYPLDGYVGQNPWYLTTAWYGRLLFYMLRLFAENPNPRINPQAFHILLGTDVRASTQDKVLEKALGYLDWITSHMRHLNGQVMSEQLNAKTGEPAGALELAWSLREFNRLVNDLLRFISDMESADQTPSAARLATGRREEGDFNDKGMAVTLDGVRRTIDRIRAAAGELSGGVSRIAPGAEIFLTGSFARGAMRLGLFPDQAALNYITQDIADYGDAFFNVIYPQRLHRAGKAAAVFPSDIDIRFGGAALDRSSQVEIQRLLERIFRNHRVFIHAVDWTTAHDKPLEVLSGFLTRLENELPVVASFERAVREAAAGVSLRENINELTIYGPSEAALANVRISSQGLEDVGGWITPFEVALRAILGLLQQTPSPNLIPHFQILPLAEVHVAGDDSARPLAGRGARPAGKEPAEGGRPRAEAAQTDSPSASNAARLAGKMDRRETLLALLGAAGSIYLISLFYDFLSGDRPRGNERTEPQSAKEERSERVLAGLKRFFDEIRPGLSANERAWVDEFLNVPNKLLMIFPDIGDEDPQPPRPAAAVKINDTIGAKDTRQLTLNVNHFEKLLESAGRNAATRHALIALALKEGSTLSDMKAHPKEYRRLNALAEDFFRRAEAGDLPDWFCAQLADRLIEMELFGYRAPLEYFRRLGVERLPDDGPARRWSSLLLMSKNDDDLRLNIFLSEVQLFDRRLWQRIAEMARARGKAFAKPKEGGVEWTFKPGALRFLRSGQPKNENNSSTAARLAARDYLADLENRINNLKSVQDIWELLHDWSQVREREGEEEAERWIPRLREAIYHYYEASIPAASDVSTARSLRRSFLKISRIAFTQERRAALTRLTADVIAKLQKRPGSRLAEKRDWGFTVLDRAIGETERILSLLGRVGLTPEERSQMRLGFEKIRRALILIKNRGLRFTDLWDGGLGKVLNKLMSAMDAIVGRFHDSPFRYENELAGSMKRLRHYLLIIKPDDSFNAVLKDSEELVYAVEGAWWGDDRENPVSLWRKTAVALYERLLEIKAAPNWRDQLAEPFFVFSIAFLPDLIEAATRFLTESQIQREIISSAESLLEFFSLHGHDLMARRWLLQMGAHERWTEFHREAVCELVRIAAGAPDLKDHLFSLFESQNPNWRRGARDVIAALDRPDPPGARLASKPHPRFESHRNGRARRAIRAGKREEVRGERENDPSSAFETRVGARWVAPGEGDREPVALLASDILPRPLQRGSRLSRPEILSLERSFSEAVRLNELPERLAYPVRIGKGAGFAVREEDGGVLWDGMRRPILRIRGGSSESRFPMEAFGNDRFGRDEMEVLFARIHQLGLDVTEDVRDGKPLLIRVTDDWENMKPARRYALVKSIEFIRQNFNNVRFKADDLSDDLVGFEPEKTINVFPAHLEEQALTKKGMGVLVWEEDSHQDFLPFTAMFMAAIAEGRLEYRDLDDKGIQLFQTLIRGGIHASFRLTPEVYEAMQNFDEDFDYSQTTVKALGRLLGNALAAARLALHAAGIAA
ncbi:MAG: glycogen/starch synthase [Candidatus Omnitrophica bacterium]|nr:glycogen/starch synthase [Candidatus Omnitrophota bacterium]